MKGKNFLLKKHDDSNSLLDEIAQKLGYPNIEDMRLHHLNPLHFYSRLRDLGFSETEAKKIAKLYEEKFFKKVTCSDFKEKTAILFKQTRPIHLISMAYVGFMLIITLIFHNHIPHWQRYLAIYTGYEIGIWLIYQLTKSSCAPLFQFIGYLYPWFSIPYFYEFLRNYIHAIFPNLFDPLIHHFELALFGVHPTVYLQRFVCPLLTEIMAWGYFSYYLIYIFPPLIFFLFKRKSTAPLIFSMTLAYYVCFVIFVLFPCAGPRFTLADKYTVSLTGYFLPAIQAKMMAKFALKGAAFPSSHVAMVVAATLTVRRYMRKLYYFMFPLPFMVVLGAVYGRYHYVTDVTAGALVGIFSCWLTYKIYQES